jgi:hypothetical protein
VFESLWPHILQVLVLLALFACMRYGWVWVWRAFWASFFTGLVFFYGGAGFQRSDAWTTLTRAINCERNEELASATGGQGQSRPKNNSGRTTTVFAKTHLQPRTSINLGMEGVSHY